MREIKFRGLRKDGFGLVHGLLVKDAYGIFFIETLSGTHIYTQKVIPESVGQFTGLHDKNGVEIYEGDILDSKDRIVKVVWHEHAGQWDTDFIRYKGKLSSNGLQNSEWKYRAVVIGNIHANPELLQQQ